MFCSLRSSCHCWLLVLVLQTLDNFEVLSNQGDLVSYSKSFLFG